MIYYYVIVQPPHYDGNQLLLTHRVEVYKENEVTNEIQTWIRSQKIDNGSTILYASATSFHSYKVLSVLTPSYQR